MTRYRTLEDVLVGEGFLPRPDLDRALTQRNGMRGGLGWHLVEAGLLSEEALAQAFARLYELPLADLATAVIEPGVLQLFSLDRMRRDLFLPLRHEGDRLVVAVADPGNDFVLQLAPDACEIGVVTRDPNEQ